MTHLFKHYSGLLFALMLATAQPVPAQENQAAATNALQKYPFPVGEVLVYKIYWGVIPVGQSFIKTEMFQKEGTNVLAIRYRTKTNKLFNTIYPIDDVAESLIDPDTFLPIRFTISLTRRKGKTERIVTFDRDNLKAYMVTTSTGKTNQLAITADTRDLISFLYHTRAAPLPTNQTLACSFVADSGMLNMKLKTYDFESIKLDTFNKVSALKMEPIAKLDNLLIEDGKVMTWIAKERCLAVRMTIKAPIADVTIDLTEVRGPGNDTWTRGMLQHFGSTNGVAEPP